MGSEAVTIRSFAEAAGAALGIHDGYAGYGHAAAALDVDSALVDLTVFSEPVQTVYDALFYAHGLVLFDPTVRRIVLLSAVRRDLTHVMERDVEILRGAQRLFAQQCGVAVVDWVLTDGEQVRSIARTTAERMPWQDVA